MAQRQPNSAKPKKGEQTPTCGVRFDQSTKTPYDLTAFPNLMDTTSQTLGELT